MIINKTYSKRPYITPACNISDMELILQAGLASAGGHNFTPGNDEEGNPSIPPPPPPGVKSSGFYSSGDNFYQGYGNDW